MQQNISKYCRQTQYIFKQGHYIILLIRCYQYTISPDHGACSLFARAQWIGCKFYPSCSAYAAMAIRQYGLVHGSVVLTQRILRCHPWSRGGYDPIP